MLDIKIFVETDADVRILRRALRDVEERGRTLQSVVTQYLTTVKPMHEQYVEPSRKFADIIVLEDVAEFILMNFGKAGRKNLSLTREELSDLRQAVTEEKRGTGSVASPRLDSIASLIFGLPRKDAQARIEKGLVFVNNAPCPKPERQIAEGDRITVRGLGRARVESFGGTSRKGRIFLDFVRNI